MTPERWQHVQELYHAARAVAVEDRAAFLASACAGDAALHREVQAMLDQPVSTGGFEEFVGGSLPDLPAAEEEGQLTGAQLGTYRVLALLGKGGMGEVYRAHDARLGRDVALKVLPRRFTRHAARLARFQSEARMLAALNHPSIGAIYGLEQIGDTPALVLELVEGDTLAARLQRGPLALRDALAIAGQIADALEAAHQKGITHRDLKPANVKITPAGQVKVLDFGLAKAARPEDSPTPASFDASNADSPVTRAGSILGTPNYMSPEQARGLAVDTRTDIWAFGCVLYEMLAGQPPFTAPTSDETIEAILEREPDWTRLPSSTPRAVRALLARCLTKDREYRVATMAEAGATMERIQRGWNRWRVAALAAAAVASLAIGLVVWQREAPRPVDRSEWVQLTQFPDSVVQPALSPDGRMLAFIRGPSASTPMVPGQVYVKTLPDGDAVPLTEDPTAKLSPVFSPDGSRLAYGTVNGRFEWDVWSTPPTAAGTPQLWLRNASGLVWGSKGRVFFAEMKKNPHMAIVTADERRAGQRDVYVPALAKGMAHRSYPSPDGRYVLVVEMDDTLLWMPCRVLPADGRSAGVQVGPPGGGCTYGAWSPDGRWMYLTSNAGGTNHIWRQRFPDGQPEQVTSGPTEEEGVAVAPDGRSLITAVAVQSVSAWLHDGERERQVAVEGNTAQARFAPDGRTLYYRIVEQATGTWDYRGVPGELYAMDVATGRSESLTPGMPILDYDVSPEGERIVVEIDSADPKTRIRILPADGASVPRTLRGVDGTFPRFGPGGDIFFLRRAEGAAGFVYRVRTDGTGLQQAFSHPAHGFGGISRDGRWIRVWAPRGGAGGPVWQALPVEGGPGVLLNAGWAWHWSASEDRVAISGAPLPPDRSYIIPLGPGEVMPPVPPEGFRSEQEIASLPGARRVDAGSVVPGPLPDVYAFSRHTTHRNLFRIPIR